MNSISPLSKPNNQSIKDQIEIKDDPIKRDIYSMENSTSNDNSPAKNNMKISIPLNNPTLYSAKNKSSKISKATILDFDKVISILISNKNAKKKKKQKINNPSDQNLLNRKTSRPSSSIKKKQNKTICLDKNKEKEKEKKNKTIINNLYSIDNFISSTMKIVEKKEFVHIECPKYKEIVDENDDVDVEVNCYESDEDISNERYINLHWPMEENEIHRRLNLNSNKNDKKKSLKPKEKPVNKSKNKIKKHSTLSYTDSTIDDKHCS